jgi:hypothetical protein
MADRVALAEGFLVVDISKAGQMEMRKNMLKKEFPLGQRDVLAGVSRRVVDGSVVDSRK